MQTHALLDRQRTKNSPVLAHKVPAPPRPRCSILLMTILCFSILREGQGFLQQRIGFTRRSIQIDVSKDINVDQLKTEASDEVFVVRNLTETALDRRGSPEGLRALEELGTMCSRRLPFDFATTKPNMEGSVTELYPGLLPKQVTDEIFEKVREMERHGWLSTNPDSVDGLPSFHINLISDGTPLVNESLKADELDDFQTSIRGLTELVKPFLYDKLLPHVNKLLNTTNIQIGDVFLRRYGQDIMDGESRKGISAHYDVFSQVTSVVALDDVASEGKNGLYTTHMSYQQGSYATTSNHAALRRFFPMKCGDGVIHTFDVLHGVDVEEGLDRTSLIIWFISEDEKKHSISPWLSRRRDLDSNHITQFVLASALESHGAVMERTGFVMSRPQPQRMLNTPGLVMSFPSPKPNPLSLPRTPFELYLESASRGNAFAMTRLGSLCEHGNATSPMMAKAAKVLESMESGSELINSVDRFPSKPNIALAKRFWLEGSIRGSPLAQMALADELMVESALYDNDSDCRLMAAVLFGLAAQQSSEQAIASLQKVIEQEVLINEIKSEDDFAASPVVQVARAALSNL